MHDAWNYGSSCGATGLGRVVAYPSLISIVISETKLGPKNLRRFLKYLIFKILFWKHKTNFKTVVKIFPYITILQDILPTETYINIHVLVSMLNFWHWTFWRVFLFFVFSHRGFKLTHQCTRIHIPNQLSYSWWTFQENLFYTQTSAYPNFCFFH